MEMNNLFEEQIKRMKEHKEMTEDVLNHESKKIIEGINCFIEELKKINLNDEVTKELKKTKELIKEILEKDNLN